MSPLRPSVAVAAKVVVAMSFALPSIALGVVQVGERVADGRSLPAAAVAVLAAWAVGPARWPRSPGGASSPDERHRDAVIEPN